MAIVPTDAQGVLSDGTWLNPLFVNAHIYDVGTVVLTSSVAVEYFPAYVVPGISGVAFSLDGEDWGADGADAPAVDVTPSGTPLHFKLVATSVTPVSLALPAATPHVWDSGDVSVVKDTLALQVILPDPTVTATATVTVTLDPLVLTAGLLDPAVTTGTGVSVTPDPLILALTVTEPTVSVEQPQSTTYYGLNTRALSLSNGSTQVDAVKAGTQNVVGAGIGAGTPVQLNPNVEGDGVYRQGSVSVVAPTDATTLTFKVNAPWTAFDSPGATFTLPAGKKFIAGNTYTVTAYVESHYDDEESTDFTTMRYGDGSYPLTVTGVFGDV